MFPLNPIFLPTHPFTTWGTNERFGPHLRNVERQRCSPRNDSFLRLNPNKNNTFHALTVGWLVFGQVITAGGIVSAELTDMTTCPPRPGDLAGVSGTGGATDPFHRKAASSAAVARHFLTLSAYIPAPDTGSPRRLPQTVYPSQNPRWLLSPGR